MFASYVKGGIIDQTEWGSSLISGLIFPANSTPPPSHPPSLHFFGGLLFPPRSHPPCHSIHPSSLPLHSPFLSAAPLTLPPLYTIHPSSPLLHSPFLHATLFTLPPCHCDCSFRQCLAKLSSYRLKAKPSATHTLILQHFSLETNPSKFLPPNPLDNSLLFVPPNPLDNSLLFLPPTPLNNPSYFSL